MAEQPLGKLVEVVVPLAAFEQVAEDHRIGDRPLDRHSRAAQGEHVVLEVLPDLLDLGIGQDRPQGLEHLVGIEDPAMDRPAQRQVIRQAGLPAHGDAHQRGAQRIDVGRLGVEAEPGLALQLGQKVARTARAYPRPDSRPPRSGPRLRARDAGSSLMNR